jgi:hypothetical protein
MRSLTKWLDRLRLFLPTALLLLSLGVVVLVCLEYMSDATETGTQDVVVVVDSKDPVTSVMFWYTRG